MSASLPQQHWQQSKCIAQFRIGPKAFAPNIPHPIFAQHAFGWQNHSLEFGRDEGQVDPEEGHDTPRVQQAQGDAKKTIKKKEEELDTMEEERSSSFSSGPPLLQSSGSESEKEDDSPGSKVKATGSGVPPAKAVVPLPPPKSVTPPPPPQF